MSFNPYAPPEAEVRDVEAPDRPDTPPPMWNPGAATAWSLLFSPAFGSYLQMVNWRALGEPELAEKSRKWFVGSLVYLAVFGTLAATLPESKPVDMLTRVIGLVYLLVWYSASGKLQVHRVKTRFGKAYPRRGWSQPVLCALGVFIVYAAAIGTLAYLLMP